jgi:hypothetical protein
MKLTSMPARTHAILEIHATAILVQTLTSRVDGLDQRICVFATDAVDQLAVRFFTHAFHATKSRKLASRNYT